MKFLSVFTLATTAQAVIMSSVVDYEMSGSITLSNVLNDFDLYTKVLDHGCWCSKLDINSDHTLLGGPEWLDDTDKLCKDWFTARHCVDKLVGGSCRKQNMNQEYQIEAADTSDPASWQCKTTYHATGDPISQCAQDACAVDLKFANLILNEINLTPGWDSMPVLDVDTCLLPDVHDKNMICTGTAPNFKQVLAPANP